MTEKDRFSGDWLINEYVYDPDGTLPGRGGPGAGSSSPPEITGSG